MLGSQSSACIQVWLRRQEAGGLGTEAGPNPFGTSKIVAVKGSLGGTAGTPGKPCVTGATDSLAPMLPHFATKLSGCLMTFFSSLMWLSRVSWERGRCVCQLVLVT